MGKWEDREMGRWGDRRIELSGSYVHPPINPSPYPPFLLLLLLILLFNACYNPREGCLDLRATNFEVDADRPCNRCCTYPQLLLVFEHKVQKDSAANLTYTTATYRDGAGNSFRIRDIQFYVSNARLVRADNSEVFPTDSLTVRIQPPGGTPQTATIADNVALVNRNNFSPAEMGTFLTTGSFAKVRFTLGLQPVQNQVLPNSLPDSVVNHPLENTGMYINPDTGFVINRLQLFNDLNQTDTTFTTFRLLQQDTVPVELPIPNPFNLVEGRDLRVIIRINYLDWFKNVNIKTDPPATVATKIRDNLRNAFSITRVEL